MPHLTPDWAAHLESGVSHRLGAVHADGRPEICRGLAAQSLTDGRIEVLVAIAVSEPLLAAVRASGRIAYVAAQPGSQRSLHLKGLDAECFSPTAAQHGALFERCRDRLVERVAPFGFSRATMMAIWYDLGIEQLAGVRFWPIGAWDQSPGPGAGNPVEMLP